MANPDEKPGPKYELASECLTVWALVSTYGRVPGWKPGKANGGDPLESWHTDTQLRVERFFVGENRRRWRTLAIQIMLGREVTMTEKPEWSEFAHRYRRWYRKHPIAKPTKGFEKE